MVLEMTDTNDQDDFWMVQVPFTLTQNEKKDDRIKTTSKQFIISSNFNCFISISVFFSFQLSKLF